MKINDALLAVILILNSVVYPRQIKTIAVLNLEAQGISISESSVLTDRLRSTLINVGDYVVVDRGNMEEILKEQGFQQTGCTSDECVAEVGKLLGVQYMVSGSVGKFGKTYTIQLQILNIETGAIEQSSSYDYDGEMENLLKKGIRTALLRLLEKEETPETISALKTGTLQLNVTPPECIVRIDGIEYNPEDVKNLEMLIGTHIIEVSAPNLYPHVEQILISKDTSSLLTVDLYSITQKKHRKRLLLNAGLWAVVLIVPPNMEGTKIAWYIETWGGGTAILFSIYNLYNWNKLRTID